MAADFVNWQQDGHVAWLVLDEPSTRNSLSPPMVDALCAAITRIDDTPSVRCAILTGTGTAFSSGGDPKRMLEPVYTAASTDQIVQQYGHSFHRIPKALHDLKKPIIAAINGHAIGAGLDLACYCDIRVAVEEAKFASSFVKLGLVPGDGGAWILPQVIGAAHAAQLMLTGSPIDAREALRIGLISQAVPRERLRECAFEVANAIAGNPPHATRMIKQLQRASAKLPLAEALVVAAQMQAVAHKTADHIEAVTALLEKRVPKFSEDADI